MQVPARALHTRLEKSYRGVLASDLPHIMPTTFPAWHKRELASDNGQWCMILPVSQHHFERATRLLISLNRLAKDTVPIFVVLGSRPNVGKWHTVAPLVSNNASTPASTRPSDRLADHDVLLLSDLLEDSARSAAEDGELTIHNLFARTKACTHPDATDAERAAADYNFPRDRTRWDPDGCCEVFDIQRFAALPSEIQTIWRVRSPPTNVSLSINQTLRCMTPIPRDRLCDWDGSAPRQMLGHVKKLYAARHVGRSTGCKIAWVVDVDSMPMRSFSFSEIFTKSGKILVSEGNESRVASDSLRRPAHGSVCLSPHWCGASRVSESCVKAAEFAHGRAPSFSRAPRVAAVGPRENDFWLLELSEVEKLMSGPKDAGGASFLSRWVQAGTVSDSLLYTTWMIQGVVDGSIQSHRLVSLTSEWDAMMRCALSDPDKTDPVGWPITQRKPSFGANTLDVGCWARFFAGTLGQGGYWGNSLLRWNRFWSGRRGERFRELVKAVPFCVSNCHEQGRVRELFNYSGLGLGTAPPQRWFEWDTLAGGGSRLRKASGDVSGLEV